MCSASRPPLRLPPACPSPAAGAQFELDERGQGSASGQQVLERLSFGSSSLQRNCANQGRCDSTAVQCWGWCNLWAIISAEWIKGLNGPCQRCVAVVLAV